MLYWFLAEPIGIMEDIIVDFTDSDEVAEGFGYQQLLWTILPVFALLAGAAHLLKQAVIFND